MYKSREIKFPNGSFVRVWVADRVTIQVEDETGQQASIVMDKDDARFLGVLD